MKKCPFCAEEILDEAIKCRYCGSFLSAAPADAKPAAAPAQPAQPAPQPAAAPAPAQPAEAPPQPAAAPAPVQPAASSAPASPPFARAAGADETPSRQRKTLYAGSPSWRAFLKQYVLVVFTTVLVMVLAFWIASAADGGGLARALSLLIPLAIGAIAFATVNFYRKSKVFRVTTTNIESEYGILSKKIDVLELWRCRDVRYRQSLMDRILGIAHIDVFTADVTTPHLELVGLPASRQLFEQIRDSIEIQRHSRNVYGVIQ